MVSVVSLFFISLDSLDSTIWLDLFFFSFENDLAVVTLKNMCVMIWQVLGSFVGYFQKQLILFLLCMASCFRLLSVSVLKNNSGIHLIHSYIRHNGSYILKTRKLATIIIKDEATSICSSIHSQNFSVPFHCFYMIIFITQEIEI